MADSTSSTVAELMTELDSDPDWEVEYAQAEMMWEYVDGVREPLVERLDAADSRTRERAATALGWRRDADAVRPLVSTLRTDPDVSVRDAAARALGDIGDPAAIEALRVVVDTADSPLRETAVVALGRCGGVDELDATLRAVVSQSDPDDAFHAAVIRGLGRAATPAASEALTERLRSGEPDATERERIASALQTHRSDRARATLRELLTDEHPPVRAAAIQGIDDAVSFVTATHMGPTWRESLAQWLGIESVGGPMARDVELLLERLDDPHPDVRRQAARAIGTIGHPGLLAGRHRRARAALTTLAEDDPDRNVREAATRALSLLDA